MSSEPDKKLHASLPYEVAARSREAERQRHDTVAISASLCSTAGQWGTVSWVWTITAVPLWRGLKNAVAC